MIKINLSKSHKNWLLLIIGIFEDSRDLSFSNSTSIAMIKEENIKDKDMNITI